MDKSLRQAFLAWKKRLLDPINARFPERSDLFETSSGIELNTVELPEHPDPDYIEKRGFPGAPPFTRGIHPSMYRSRLWTMRQYAGFGSAEETNRRFHYLLDQGQTGLSVAFDLPTQIGLDPDHPLARGEVGRVGVSIARLGDMKTLFQGIPLEDVSTSMTINAPAAVLLAMYVALGKQQGLRPDQLRGTIQNDILKEYTARGTYIFPPGPALRLITDTFAYCSQQLPQFNAISISGYHLREAGATAVQELAFTLANALAYLQAAVQAGLELDDFLPQISFFFSADSNFLEEIAKFRAARRLWSSLLEEHYQVRSERARQLRFHTQTAGSTLTAQQPHNNIVRVTLQALSAVLGGTQSLHTNSFDEALGLPTEQSVRLALRTQQIIAYESGVVDTSDPLGGSYVIEKLTDEIEERARAYLDTIADMGGALEAIQAGYIQREIQESAYRSQKALESKGRVVVGVNRFQEESSPKIDLHQSDPVIEQHQREELEALRESRMTAAVDGTLEELRQTAVGNENLLPVILGCVEADATLGEICATLRDCWGEYNPPSTL
ncbi:MAG: methylmalonyl-CoA mutase family protein [Anaerolineales bacterium]